jgi:hypothetical protein
MKRRGQRTTMSPKQRARAYASCLRPSRGVGKRKIELPPLPTGRTQWMTSAAWRK